MKTKEIAQILGLKLIGDADREITGVADLETATAEQVAYIESDKRVARSSCSQAGCLIVPREMELEGFTQLASSHPKYDFARLAAILHPMSRPPVGIHATAQVSPDACLGPGVSIGPYCLIGEKTEIGARSRIGAFCHIFGDCQIGEDVFLQSRVTLYPKIRLGNRVVVHAGAVIGSEGFGFVEHEGHYTKFPQIGGVVIEEDVEIGSNVTIDRGSLGITRISSGTKIDNLVHVAHNVTIAEDCVIAAQTGISGSSSIGHHAIVAGQVGIADHVRIEERARLGAQAGIPTGKIIRKGEFVWGTPARSMEVFKEQYGNLSRLPRLRQEVADLKKRVAEIEEMIKNHDVTS